MIRDRKRAEPAVPALATLVDVARAAKVSVSTASRAINGRPYVSEPIRAQVLEEAWACKSAARVLLHRG